jgi:hypothetical protein
VKTKWRAACKWAAYWLVVVAVSGWNENAWMFLAGLFLFIIVTLPKPVPDTTRSELLQELRALRAFVERLNLGLDYLLHRLGQPPPPPKPPSSNSGKP